MPAGQSNFDGDGSTLDTATTLATGAVTATTTLAADIDDMQEYMTFASPISLPSDGGAAFIDGETIWVLSFDPDYPSEIGNMSRGADGTSAAAHTAGAPVLLVGKQRYQNPAHVDATIAMQDTINDLLARVAALESP